MTGRRRSRAHQRWVRVRPGVQHISSERSDGFDGEEGLKIRKTPLRWLAGC
jgi:hypothetical protein